MSNTTEHGKPTGLSTDSAFARNGTQVLLDQADYDGMHDNRPRKESKRSASTERGTHEAQAPEENNENDLPVIQITAEPPSQRCFNSWDDLHSYLRQYQLSTHQCFRNRTSTSVKTRNARLDSRHDTSQKLPHDDEYLDESWGCYSVTFECVYGGKFRSRGTGKRKRKSMRCHNCPAKINALLVRMPKAKKHVVRISKVNTTHNHELSKDEYKNFVSNRTNWTNEEIEQVRELRDAGMDVRQIHNLLNDRVDRDIMFYDVRNLLNRLKREGEEQEPWNHILTEAMTEFCFENNYIDQRYFDYRVD